MRSRWIRIAVAVVALCGILVASIAAFLGHSSHKEEKKNSETVEKSKAELYREALYIVSALAHGEDDKEARFRILYERDLLPVESLKVEELMVRARRVLDACKRPLLECEERKNLQTIAYQLSNQIREEREEIDAIAQPR